MTRKAESEIRKGIDIKLSTCYQHTRKQDKILIAFRLHLTYSRIIKTATEGQVSNDINAINKNKYFLFYKITRKAQLQLIYKLSRSYIFRHYRVIFRQLVFINSQSYISISIAAVGNTT